MDFATTCDWSRLDANSIVFGSETGEIGIFDFRFINNPNRKPVYKKCYERQVRKVKFNDSKTNCIASGSDDCYARVVCLKNDTDIDIRYNSLRHNDYVTSVDWHPQKSDHLYTCSWDGTIRVHNTSLKIKNGF
jgi:WD40 repeat protein